MAAKLGVKEPEAMSSARGDSNPFTPPATEIGAIAPPGPALGGMPFGGFLLIYFCASFIFMWLFWALFWSGWMTLMMGWDFLTTLMFRGLPGGFFVGFLTSTLITAYQGLFMRRKTAVIAFAGDRPQFIDEVTNEVRRVRYRLTHQSERVVAFSTRGLFHYGYFDLIVEVGDGHATLAGPGAVVRTLSKKLCREDSPR
jgi:hypothetical protein